MDWNAAAVFVQVIESGSFTGAAKVLGLPKSTVSDKVAELEKALGVTLMTRTTRRLRLTEVGDRYFRDVEGALRQMEAAGETAAQAQRLPAGRLRISVPPYVDLETIGEAVRDYRRRYSNVQVEVDVTDRRVDLVAEGYDLAIRAGRLRDSSLIAKRIGAGCLILIASPAYLKSAPPLRHPKDLSRHQCIRFVPPGRKTPWMLRTAQGKTLRIDPPATLASDSKAMVKHLALRGQGVTLLIDSQCRQELKTRRLVQVLPEWTTEPVPVHLIYPANKFGSPKLKAMLPLLEERLRPLFPQ
jgi:DNA-binding transcriptional LysR family regulator